MREAVENGYTVYVTQKEGKLVGTGLRLLGKRRGIQPVYMEEENLNIAEENFSFLHLLNNGKMLQMYKANYGSKVYPYYIAQIGEVVGEGPYGEDSCFMIDAEGVADNFYEALMSLEEKCRNCDEEKGKKTIKKAYRLYGSARYETCNIENRRKRG